MPLSVTAQQVTSVTRQDAIASARAHGPRASVALADTSAAFAQLLTARTFQNPAVSASYSKSTPQYHFALELPFELPPLRGARIGSARAARASAHMRYEYEIASIQLEADTTYTRALAARERARLSRRNAQAADSLLQIAIARRDAGDASELDVQLATVNAGQVRNTGTTDSLIFISTLLDLQAVMGIAASAVEVYPADSLLPPPANEIPSLSESRNTLPIAAAQAALESARLAAKVQRWSIFATPSLALGFETHDPSGAEAGFLPTIGIGIPFPLLNRNRGLIAAAEAEQSRAVAELQLATIQSRTEIARAERERTIALTKVALDRDLVSAANKVATMSLTAYREGAASLPNVMEAQSNARAVIGQYIEDLASAWIAIAELRTLTMAAPAGMSR